MSHAILIAGHGSRDPDGIREFLGLARAFREHRPELPVGIGFLEFARPTIQEGIDQLAAAGHGRIVVLPGVLMAAGHAKNDLASEVRLARQRYPGNRHPHGRRARRRRPAVAALPAPLPGSRGEAAAS